MIDPGLLDGFIGHWGIASMEASGTGGSGIRKWGPLYRPPVTFTLRHADEGVRPVITHPFIITLLVKYLKNQRAREKLVKRHMVLRNFFAKMQMALAV